MKPHSVHNVFDGTFNTFSGMCIDLMEPTVDMISIVDIAHALSHICRFGGHSTHFYTVGQHSLLVAGICASSIRKEALLHDAAEAYVGDIIKPLKVILGNLYEEIEWRFMLAIIQKFNLDPANLSRVKAWDKMALEMEYDWLHRGHGREIEVYAEKLKYFDPFDSSLTFTRFMNAYEEYFGIDLLRNS